MFQNKILLLLICLLLVGIGLNKVSSMGILIEKDKYSTLAMSSESLDQIIAKYKPLITVEINGKRRKNIPIKQTDSSSYSVFTTAIDIFTKSDSMLRMIIDRKRLESRKANNYVEIKFNSPVNLNIATGGNLSVSKIVIPLSEEETTPEWNFYYSHNSDGWFALRWMQPDSNMFTKLQNEIGQLIDN